MSVGVYFVFLVLSGLAANVEGLAAAVTKGTIIGGGRIGGLLHDLNGGVDQLITRDSGETIPAGVEGPIYVCTRNNDLEKIIEYGKSARR